MFWSCEGYRPAHRKERILPNGTFQLVIELSDGYIRQWGRAAGAEDFYLDSPALVVGMQSQYNVIDTAGLKSMVGVSFRPGCARAFLEAPSHEFYNCDTPLDGVWGRLADELRARLQEAVNPNDKFQILETVLRQRLQQRHTMHGAVRYALGEFAYAPHCRNVLDVAQEVGLSRRRFAQVFREQVGVTPKLYCRILRFQAAIQQIRRGEEVDWAGVALECGYCDQAHMANEFREFAGISPGVYAGREYLWQNHVPMD